MTDNEKALRIRELNDNLRINGHVRNGRVVAVGSLTTADEKLRNLAVAVMRQFTAFDDDNDPYGEHDFGAFDIGDDKFMFKIDYYALDEQTLSEHPEDIASTIRVCSIMFAEDY